MSRLERQALLLETLEDRLVPVAYTWTGLAAGTYDWTNPANWSPNTGFPNSAADTAALNVALTGNVIIQIPTNVSVNTLTTGPTGNFTQNLVSTGGTIIIDNGAGSGVLTNVGTANVSTFDVTISLASDTTINNNTTRNLTFANIDLGTGHNLTVNAGNTANTTSLGNITGTGHLFLNRSAAGALAVTNIAISGNVNADISGTGTITIGGNISGGSSLTKTGSGAGVLILTGNNTYSGPTNVNAGILQVGAGATGQLGTGGNVTIGGPATLAFSRTNAFTVDNVLSGAGSILINGAAGNMTLTSNSSSFTGAVTITTGSLNLRDNGSLAGASSYVLGNGNLTLDNQGTNNIVNRMGGAAINFTGTGALSLIGANNSASSESLGAITLANGSAPTIRSRKGTGTGTNAITIASVTRAIGMNMAQIGFDGGLFIGNGTTAPLVDVGGNNTIVITDASGLPMTDGIIPFAMTQVNGTIQGSGLLGSVGGFARLTASNAVVSATTIVNPANLTAGDNALYTANTVLGNGTQTANSVFLSLNAARTLSGNSTLITNAIGAGFGAVTGTVSVSSIELGGAGTLFSALGSTNLTLSGNITFASNITKEGMGNSFISGDNFIGGPTQFNSGILIVSGNTSLAASSGFIFAGGTLRVVSNSTGMSPITVNPGGGAIQASTASTVVSFEAGATLNAGTNLTLTGAGDILFDSLITGDGAMNVSTTGLVDWRYANNYTGGTTFASTASHNIRISSNGMAGPFGLGTLTLITGTPILTALDQDQLIDNPILAQTNMVFGIGQNLVLTGNVTMNAARTFTVNSSNVTMTGALTGGFGVTKAGIGGLILTSDANSYTTATISAGLFQVGDGVTGAAGNSSVSVAAGATAIYNRPGIFANQTTATGAGNWQVLGGANLTFTGVSTATGNWTLSGNGTMLTFTGAGTAASGNVIVGPGATLRYGNNVTPTGILGLNVNVLNDGDFQITRNAAIGNLAGRITGSGNFSLTATAAAATISLLANNSYSGNTTITAPLGTTININGSLPNTPNIIVNSGTGLTRISLNNTLNAPRSGRFGLSTANIALNGSVMLELLGNNTLSTSESLGPITLNQLANVTLRSSIGNAGGTAALTVAKLTKASDNVMLVFDGANNSGGTSAPLVASGNNTITITDTTGLPAAGTIFTYGMVTVGGTANGNGALGGTGGFATLSGNRIVSATNFVTATRFDTGAATPAPAGANVLVLSNVTLAGDTNVLNSLFMGGTIANTLNGAAGNTLNVRHIGGFGGGNVAYIISVSNVNLGSGATPATYFFNASGTGNMQIDSIVAGSGGLNKEGLGPARALFMPNSNSTYTGVTTINGGLLEVRNNNSLGATGPGGGTVVGPNTQLSIGQGNLVVAENLTMNGGLLMDILGNNTLTGTVTVIGDSRVSVTTAANRLTLANDVVLANANLTISSLTANSNTTISGNISGAGNITQNSTATTIFSGSNTYNGTTTILSGIFQIGNNGTSGSFGVGNVTNNGTLVFGRTDTFGVPNNISGNGSIVQAANGGTILSGNNSYTGNTTVFAGKLFVNGVLSASAMNVALNGTLGGIGSIGGNTSVDGVLAPGVNSPGLLGMANLTFRDNSTFAVELGSAQFDQLNVFGNVTIGNNVSLNFSSFAGFVPSSNTSFIIIQNDDVDPIVGTFLGLPEGAVLTNFLGLGSDATITYVGGTGNDLVLNVTAPSNFPPTVTPANGTLAYLENDGAKLLDNALVVADVDSPNLAGAVITFSGGYVSSQDVLTFVNQNGINHTFNAANGTLTLSGNASLANYQTALRSITYTNNSDNPSTATRTLSLVVNDGLANSSPITRTITVTAVNDAPTVNTTLANATFLSSGGPIAVDNLVGVADLDSATLSSANIAITANFVAGQDVLAFANTANITSSYNSANGTLTLTGVDTVANYQAALRAVTYNNTAGAPNTTPRTLSFQVNDGAGANNLSNVAARTVTLVITSPPVVTANQSFTLAENTANGTLVGTLAATDPDGPTTFQNWTITGGNTGGAFAISPSSGNITVANSIALDREVRASFTLTVTVSDGINTSVAQNVTINLNDINDVPPVVTGNQSFSTPENAVGGTVVGTVLATDGDVTPTTFQSWTISSGNPGGAFAIHPTTGVITVVNSAGLSGNVFLGVTVSDAIHVSTEQIVTVQMIAGNVAPVINAGQVFSIAENSNNGVSVGTAAATDANANTTLQNWLITGGNANGAFSINATTGQLAVANQTALDREAVASFNLTLTVSDGTDTSSPQNVTINLNDVNDVAPVVTANQTFTLPENTSNGTAVGTIAATDGDVTPTTFQNWTIVGGNANGAFSVNATTGQIAVANSTALNREATASFTLNMTVSDGVNPSAARAVTINLTDVNDVQPIITANQTFSLPENTGNGTAVGTVAATDGDVTPTTFQAWTITGGNTNGAFSVNATTGQIAVANSTALNREATASFTLNMTVSDGINTSAARAVTINLTDVNDVLPVVTANQTFSLPENTGNGTAVGTVAATDGDVTPTTFQNWTITGGNANGAFSVNATTGQIAVANSTALNREAKASFTLNMTVSDGINNSAARAVTINLTDVNDVLPIITANQTFTLPENTGNGALVGTVAATDGDVTPTTFQNWTITGGNTNGAFSVNATTGQIAVANSTALNRETIASFTLNMTVSDGVNTSAPRSVTINLTDVNDVTPVITVGQVLSVSQGSANGAIVGTVAATDGDVTPTTFQNWTITAGNTGGAFALHSSSGQLSVANNAALTGNFTLSLTVSDGVNTSSAQNVTVHLTGINFAPTLSPANGTLNFVENDGARAVDGNLTVGDDGGTLVSAAIAFTAGYLNGQDVLTFANQNGITGNFNSANGTLTLAGNATLANYQTALRSITYTNNSEDPSPVDRTLSIVVNDGAQSSAPAIRTITVASVNDAPVVAMSSGNVSYTAGSPPIVIDNGLTLSDLDNRNFTGATITISSNFAAAQDVLGFANQFGITGSYNASNGTLTLTGPASLTAYRVALRSVTYVNSSGAPSALPRTISFRVNDGSATNNLSNIGQRIVQIGTGVNQPPVLSPVADRAFSLSTLSNNVTLSATDPENSPIAYGATLDSVGHFLRTTYGFSVDMNNLYLNYGGKQEKWFAAPNSVWYFILPNGDFYRWDNTPNSASGTKLHTVSPLYYADPTRLRDEPAGQGPIGVSIGGSVITFTNATAYQGQFRVTATASDGVLSDSKTFFVSFSNLAPTISPIADQNMPPTQDTLTLAVSAVDPEGGSVSLSVSVQSQAQALDSQYAFVGIDSASFNYGRQAEKWIYALDSGGNRVYYFLLPSGDLYLWDRTPLIAQGTFLANVGTGIYANPNLLVTPAVAASASFTGTNLTIDPVAGFVGRLLVTVRAADPTNNVSTMPFTVTVAPAPVLTQPSDRSVVGSAPIIIPLSAVDPSGLPLTYSVLSEAVALKNTYDLRYSQSVNHYFNYLGFGERWLIGAGNNIWYYVKPNGDLFRWDGANGVSTFVRTIDPRYNANPALLYNASSQATFSILGNQLTVTPASGFTGKLVLTVAANNGVFQDAKTFTINVS